MPFLKKSEMRGDCDAIPTQQDITSRAFLRNKQDKKKEPTLSEIAFRGRECRYGKRHSQGVRIVIRGWSDSNTYPITHYDTNSTICQDIS